MKTSLSIRISCGALILLGFLEACSPPPNQTIIKEEHLLIGNPLPQSTQLGATFAENNKQHQVLIGVFDTGVDYNHPLLQSHIHFDLDRQGKAIGFGYDYLALDNWASHRIVATDQYLFEFLSPEMKADILKSKTAQQYNESLLPLGESECTREKVIQYDPRLSRYINPYRDTKTETSGLTGLFHGTHVAGLASYDVKQIGLVGFRVLPYFQSKQDIEDLNLGKADRFVQNFEDAVFKAKQKGLRIINLSLGGSFTKPDPSDSAEMEKYLYTYNLMVGKFKTILQNNPQILFVAAAGNDSGWSDNDSRVQYPCGVEAENVLCVGALQYNGKLSEFTNIPLNNIDLVFAAGENIISTVPSDTCPMLDKLISGILMDKDQTLGKGMGICRFDEDSNKWIADNDVMRVRMGYLKNVYEACSAPFNQLIELSGTSMATPLVSHLAAEILIEEPGLTPPQIITTIKNRASLVQLAKGKLAVYKLKLKKPSWYKNYRQAPNLRGDGNVFADTVNKVVASNKSLKGAPSSSSLFASRLMTRKFSGAVSVIKKEPVWNTNDSQSYFEFLVP